MNRPQQHLRTLPPLAVLLCLAANAHAVDPRLFPADTEMVITINVKQAFDLKAPDSLKDALKLAGGQLLRQATVNQVRKNLQEKLPGSERVLKVFEAMDFNLDDLRTITLAHPGTIDVGKWFVIVEGRFLRDRFNSAVKKTAESEKLKTFLVNNVPVHRLKFKKGDGKAQIWFAVLDEKTLLLSYQEDVLKQALARVRDDRFEAKRIENLLKILNDKQTLSFLMTPEGIQRMVDEAERERKNPALQGNLADALSAMLDGIRSLFARHGRDLSVSGAVTLAADFQFELHVGAGDQKRAEIVTNAFTAIIQLIRALARQRAQQEPRFEALVELSQSMRAQLRGNFAVVTGNLSYVNLAKLLTLMAGNN